MGRHRRLPAACPCRGCWGIPGGPGAFGTGDTTVPRAALGTCAAGTGGCSAPGSRSSIGSGLCAGAFGQDSSPPSPALARQSERPLWPQPLGRRRPSLRRARRVRPVCYRHRPSSSPAPTAVRTLPAWQGDLFLLLDNGAVPSEQPSSSGAGARRPRDGAAAAGEAPECFAGLLPCLEAETQRGRSPGSGVSSPESLAGL